MTLTAKQAQTIIDAHDIELTFSDEEELALLEDQNPEIIDAYRALLAIACADKKEEE